MINCKRNKTTFKYVRVSWILSLLLHLRKSPKRVDKVNPPKSNLSKKLLWIQLPRQNISLQRLKVNRRRALLAGYQWVNLNPKSNCHNLSSKKNRPKIAQTSLLAQQRLSKCNTLTNMTEILIWIPHWRNLSANNQLQLNLTSHASLKLPLQAKPLKMWLRKNHQRLSY